MRRFGLIGRPLGHSASAAYFTEKFSREGLGDCEYALYELPSIGELPALLERLPELCGLNVTIPYKRELDELLGGDQPSSALILGTGGASQAVQYALAERDIPFALVSRDASKGNYTYDNLPCEVVEESLLVVNASPVGTYPRVDDAPRIPYGYVTPEHYMLDLVYNPSLTQFLAYGQQCGAHVLNGRTMFVGQAEAAWRIWNER